MKWILKQLGMGYYWLLLNEAGDEIYSLESPQMSVISDIFEQSEDVQKAILDKAKELAEDEKNERFFDAYSNKDVSDDLGLNDG